jgi:uncharacterized protein
MIRKPKKSLLKAAAYPEPTAGVRLIETHVSFIFITDSFVYKVKKPVDFGFLNFTTLDRRRFYCEEEVRLNRRLCPDLYLGVVELRATADGPAFGASQGTLIDYAVKMKRLPEERMLDCMLERDELQQAQLAEIARVIAQFHGRAAQGPQISAQGSPAALRANWEENFRQAAPFVPQLLPRRDLALIRGFAERFLAGQEDLLQARVAGGFIRDCDGDLHLGNICLTDAGVCIFDCIEFNDRFRYSDTAADIAFLLMDLEHAGRADLCPPFLEAYREAGGDPGSPGLLAFYQAYRAFVRGKVACLRAGEEGLSPEELQAKQADARSYFRLARGYCLREGLPPTLLITCGPMGSGKSSLSRGLCRELGLSYLGSDLTRKKLSGRKPTERCGEGYGQGIYSPAHSVATYAALLEGARRELLAGRSVVVDATFGTAAGREEFRELAASLGVPFFLVQLASDPRLTRERLELRSRQPGEVSDGRPELLDQQLARFEAPGAGEAILVDSGLDLDAKVDLVLRAMGLLT